MALAVAAVVCAGLGLADSAANVVARASPALAHRLAPWDGMIAARAAKREFEATPTAGANAHPVLLAREALLQEPAAVEALTVLGLQAQLAGDSERTRRIFAHSLKLTRREVPARLWAVEEAVLRGDIRGALEQYDIALRTSTDANALLFPILTRALAEPRIREELLPITTRNPSWLASFTDYIARIRVEPVGAARFLEAREKAGAKLDPAHWASLTDALVEAGEHSEAWRIYGRLHPESRRDRSRNPNFAGTPVNPTVLDWQILDFASIQKVGKTTGVLDFSVPATLGGAVVKQVQLLPPGSYRLSGRATAKDYSAGAPPYWKVTCADGREIGRTEMSAPADRGGGFSAQLTVPAGCPIQTLAFVVRPTDAIGGVTGEITQLRLEPARGGVREKS